MDRTSLSCAWLKAPHKQIYDQGGSPHFSVWNPRGSPTVQKSTSNPGPPRKQNFDEGGSPQAELRPGRIPTNRITPPHQSTHTPRRISIVPPGVFYIYMYEGYFWTREAQRERPADIRAYIHTCIHTYIHRPLWAFLGLSGPLWPLWASLGLSTYICTYTHIHTYMEKTRQHIHAYITDSWSPGPKLKTTQ